jgi:hypothetical protein
MLTRRGQLAVVKAVPGATHSWRGARAELPYSLVFASQHLSVATGGRAPLAGATAQQWPFARS